MKFFLIPVLFIATMWNIYSTSVGAIGILGDDTAEFFAAILLSAIVISLLLSSRRIMEMRRGFISKILIAVWVIALIYNLAGSWIGNAEYLIQEVKPSALFLVGGLTILCAAAPILLSAFLSRSKEPAGESVPA